MFNAIFLTYLYVYAQARKKRGVSSTRLIRERQHFSRNVIVSVAISKMGKSRIVVIEPDAKVNSQYYCRNVLGDGLLPDIRAICQHYTWTLQQDGAPSHTAKNTMDRVSATGPDLAWWRPRCHCVGGGPHVVSKSWRLANYVGATNGADDSPSGE